MPFAAPNPHDVILGLTVRVRGSLSSLFLSPSHRTCSKIIPRIFRARVTTEQRAAVPIGLKFALEIVMRPRCIVI